MPGPVPLKVTYQSPTELIDAMMVNLKLQGVYVPSSVSVPSGTSIELTIEFGPGKGMKVLAVVAEEKEVAGEKRLGLRFVRMHDKHKAWVAAEVKKRLTAQKQEEDAKADDFGELGPMLRGATVGEALEEASLDIASISFTTGKIIGIDLGTSNSAACLMTEDGPVIIEIGEDGDHWVPSIVAYEDGGKKRVGKHAIVGLRRNASRTIFGAKRFVGRDYASQEVQAMARRYPYKVVEGANGRCAVEIDGRPMNLAKVSAEILEYIRVHAEERLGETVDRAIITVPAYYNQNQRFAVNQAGRLAGFTVERILNEPTAAAIAYGVTFDTSKKILVYDLGGGTFDVSVMAVHADKMTVKATAGDTFLGGEDFDNALVQYVVAQFEKESGKALAKDNENMAILKQTAEAVKQRLSSKDRTNYGVREIRLEDGEMTRVEIEVSRNQFNSLIAPLVDRTLEICDTALREGGLEKTGVDEVLLVGGSTLVPYVRDRVAAHLNLKPRSDLAPHEVVAMGAGMLAKLQESRSKGRTFHDVLSMSIGIEIPGGRMKVVLPRNTEVPCARSYKLMIKAKQMQAYQLEVYQGDGKMVAENEHLGAVRLDGMPVGSQDPVPVSFDFSLSDDCMLKVKVRNLETNDEVEAILMASID